MRLDIPLDLPGLSFVDQLKWLESWAGCHWGSPLEVDFHCAASWPVKPIARKAKPSRVIWYISSCRTLFFGPGTS